MVGCTDYSQDIEDVNARLDQLTANQISSLTSQVSALEAYTTYLKGLDIENNVKALKENVAALQAVDATLTSELAAANANIAALSTELNKANADIQALNTDLDAVKAEAQANAAAIATANAKIQELVAEDATLAAQLNSLAANVQSNADAISANAGDIAALKTSVAALQSDIATYKALINGQIAALDTRLAAAETALATAQADIEAIEAQIEAIKADIAADKDDLANYKAETAATIEVVKKSIEDLGSEMDAKFDEVNAKFKDYVLTETFNLKINGLLNKLDKAKADYNAQIKALTKVVNANAAASAAQDALLAEADEAIKARVSALETSVETINGQIATINAKQAALEAQVAGIVSSLATTDGKVATNATNIQANADAIAALQSALTASNTAIAAAQNTISDIQTNLSAVSVKVDDLLKRIQTLVYLPDYNDGKATIRQADLYGLVLPGVPSVLTYKVAPADLASQIVSAYVQDPSVFSYDVVEVATRAAAAAALEIKSVKSNNPGEISVEVVPANFDGGFYTGAKSYSAALKLSDGNNNRSSEYTNLIAGAAPAITLDPTPVTQNQAIEYISNDQKKFFEPSEPKFIVAGDATKYTAAQLITKYGYDVRPYVQQTIFDPVYSNPSLISLYSYAQPDCEETLGFNGPVKYAVVGMNVNTPLDQRRAAAQTTVTMNMEFHVIINNVDKAYVPYTGVLTVNKIQMTSAHTATATWNWTENVAQDAANYQGTPTPYVNAGIVNVKGENDLARGGVTFADLVAATPASITVFDAAGVAAPSVAISNYAVDANGVVAYDVTGHEYGKSYTVKVVYEYPYATVTLTSALTTVDRSREPIEVVLPEKTIAFVRDIDVDTDIESVKSFYDDPKMSYAANANGKFTWAQFVQESVMQPVPFFQQAPAQAVFDYPADDIRYYIDVTAADIAANYTYDGTKYSRTFVDHVFTTYGQEVIVKKNIVITLPNITLAHSPYRVALDGSVYYSDVEPNFSAAGVANYSAPDAFSVYAVNLNDAFLPVINGTTYVWSDPAVTAQFVNVDYSFVSAPTSTGISIASNVINYNGWDKKVKVTGKMYITNSDASKIYLPTPFDNNGIYSSYEVRKYEPFKSFTALTVEDQVVNNAQVYSKNVLKYLSLVDARGYECLKNGAWVAGNGSNGFATGSTPNTVYSAGSLLDYQVVLPANIDPTIANEVSLVGNTLNFNYDSSLSLQQPLVVKVIVTLNHTWAVPNDTENNVRELYFTFRK